MNKIDEERIYKIEINSSIAQAEFVKSVMEQQGAVGLDLPSIPIMAIQDFVDDKRDNLWEITINGNVCLTVNGDKDSAEILLMFLQSADAVEFNMHPLLIDNVKDFLAGNRPNVAQFEMTQTPEE